MIVSEVSLFTHRQFISHFVVRCVFLFSVVVPSYLLLFSLNFKIKICNDKKHSLEERESRVRATRLSKNEEFHEAKQEKGKQDTHKDPTSTSTTSKTNNN